jgi:hypothetical protein
MLSKAYRNKKLLAMAKDAPYCFCCGEYSETIVAAHSNQIRDGKGKSIKSHDYRIAYCCYSCHTKIDTSNKLSKEEKKELWESAHRKTIGWLFETERLQVADIRKLICENR